MTTASPLLRLMLSRHPTGVVAKRLPRLTDKENLHLELNLPDGARLASR